MATKAHTIGRTRQTHRRMQLKSMYDHPRWRRLSKARRKTHPYCELCLAQGRANVTDTVTDHIRPHNGDWGLFFDPDNLRTLCRSHNSRVALGKNEDAD